MSVQNFFSLVAGKIKAITAIVTSAGASDGGKLVATEEATGKLSSTVMPAGLSAPQKSFTAAESLSQYNIINLYNDAGTIKGRKSDAGTNKYKAHAYVTENVEAAASGVAQMEGIVPATGLDMTKDVFLSESAGGYTQTPVSGTGKIHQFIGWPTGTDSYYFQPEEEIELA